MSSRPFRFGLGAIVALSVATGVAKADKILVFQTQNGDPQGGDAAGTQAKVVLSGLGHDVTLVSSATAALPADLSVFDTVWLVQLPAVSGSQQNALVKYVRAGGGLYLTGERACCENLNSSDQNLLANLLRSNVPMVGGTSVEGGDLMLPTAANPFGITSTPNTITRWKTLAAGLVSSVPAARAVFEKSPGVTSASVYPPEDLDQGGGCTYLAMDLTFWQTTVSTVTELSPLVENIETYLHGCADTDRDGVSDVGEAKYGTKVDDPDSDGDGLCDGYLTVPGKCVAGESPLDDFEKDGIISSLDPDDDNDGIPTSFELAAEQKAPNVDNDLIPAWSDLDSDADGYPDADEGTADNDHDGIPGIVDADDVPAPCSQEADCGGSTSGMVCDVRKAFCKPGCRGASGNGCAPGQTCSSTDSTIGRCAGKATGGNGDAGTSSGGASGATSGSGPDASVGASGGSGAAATGGSRSSGGVTGSGGVTESGDSGARNAGGGSETDGGAAHAGSGDTGGCGCTLARRASFPGSLATLATALSLCVRRRRGQRAR
jgi:hypothetical protein